MKASNKTEQQLLKEINELRKELDALKAAQDNKIIESNEIEKKSRLSETFYRSLFDNMLNGVAYCKMLYDQGQPHDFIYLQVNQAFEDQTGLKNVIGKKVSEVIPNIRKTDFSLIQLYGRVALTGTPETFEMFVEGLNMWFFISVYSPEKEYFVAIFDVITKRKQDENRLNEDESNLRERIKELNGIYSLGLSIEKFHTTDDVYNDLVITILPSSMPFPDKVYACLEIDDERYCNLEEINREPNRKFLSAPINLFGKQEGELIVGYTEDLPFMEIHEQRLINAYAERISKFTERKREEIQMATSEIRYHRLFEMAKDGILILDAENGMIIDVNQFLIEMLGYSKEQFLDKAIWEIGIFEHLAANKEKFLELQQKEYVRYENLPLESADGQKKNVEFVSNVYLVSSQKVIQCNIRDITDRIQFEESRKKIEEELRTIRDYLDNLVNYANAPIIVWNPEFSITRFNNAFEHLSGYKADEAIGRRLDFLFPESSKKASLAEIAITSTGEHWDSVEIPILRKDGQVRIALWNSASIYEQDSKTIISTIAQGQDITDRKQREEEIKQKNVELEKLNSEKDKFFSIIAHDLRSPFNSLLGFTEILEKELPAMTNDQIQYIALTLRKSATNLFTLLENLLEWSRLQRNIFTFNPEPILLLPKVLADTALVIESANRKEIVINYDIPKDLKVYADDNMLGSIIRNLTNNAVKYTPKGGKVTISAKSLDIAVECSVSDTGIGMNQEMMENLFNTDVNTSRKGTENEPSTGLGLRLFKEFVEKHSGKLWVKSEEGKGSTFYFTLSTQKYKTPQQEKAESH